MKVVVEAIDVNEFVQGQKVQEVKGLRLESWRLKFKRSVEKTSQ